MAVETSTRIAVKDALHTLLDAAINDADVSWGHPGGRVPRETVFVGNVDAYRQEARTLGNVTRQEQYVVEIVVNVMKRGSQRDASARCAELADEVETVLRNNLDLGVTNVHLAEIVGGPLREGIAGDGGRVAEISIGVGVTARLTRT